MWIERKDKKRLFINALLNLDKQVLVLRGARQVGKTSFVTNALKDLSGHLQLKLNLLHPSSFTLEGIEYLGNDFFGRSPNGEDFLKNIELQLGGIKKMESPAIIFVDEVDRFPLFLEAIQTLAEFSHKLKFVLTGSNLENISVINAATGRKKFFDLYPITFSDFLYGGGKEKQIEYFNQLSQDKKTHSDFFHKQLTELHNIYLRIGGMPKIMDAYLEPENKQAIPEIIKDMAFSIEENVKTVLDEKPKLYEYEDILRTMAFLSMSTLKFSKLQVQHAGRSEAKKLVAKTVGARVAHKIRLFESERDLSKYIIFDCGILNYLLNGSDVLRVTINSKNMAILHESFVGEELVASLNTRDDLFYWKSGNVAEVEYLLRSPCSVGIDVKSTRGDAKSLNSLAILEPSVSRIVKINNELPSIDYDHIAALPNYKEKRKISLITIPHYLTARLFEIMAF